MTSDAEQKIDRAAKLLSNLKIIAAVLAVSLVGVFLLGFKTFEMYRTWSSLPVELDGLQKSIADLRVETDLDCQWFGDADRVEAPNWKDFACPNGSYLRAVSFRHEPGAPFYNERVRVHCCKLQLRKVTKNASLPSRQ